MMKQLLILSLLVPVFNLQAEVFSLNDEGQKECQSLNLKLQAPGVFENTEFINKFEKMKDLANTYRWVLGKVKENLTQQELIKIKEAYQHYQEINSKEDPTQRMEEEIKEVLDSVKKSLIQSAIQEWIKCPPHYQSVVRKTTRSSRFICKEKTFFLPDETNPIEGLSLLTTSNFYSLIRVKQMAFGENFESVINIEDLVSSKIPSTLNVLHEMIGSREKTYQSAFLNSALRSMGCPSRY